MDCGAAFDADATDTDRLLSIYRYRYIYIYARYGLHGGQLEAIIYCRLKCTHTALHSHKSRQGV